MSDPVVLSIDEGAGAGLQPVVTIRDGHIDNVDAMRAIARGAERAEIHNGTFLQFAVWRVSKTSTQYAYKTEVAPVVFGPLDELSWMIKRLEARLDRGY